MILMIIYLDMRRQICVSYPCSPSKNESEIPESQAASGCRPGDLETLKQRGGANLVCDFEIVFGPVDDRDILENHLEHLWKKESLLLVEDFGEKQKGGAFALNIFFIFFEMLLDIQPQLRSVSWRLCSLGR